MIATLAVPLMTRGRKKLTARGRQGEEREKEREDCDVGPLLIIDNALGKRGSRFPEINTIASPANVLRPGTSPLVIPTHQGRPAGGECNDARRLFL